MTEVVWQGPELLRPFLKGINELVPSEENARKGDVMALVGSLQRFTQVRPILITPENKVVAGHHLRLAAIELGWTHIAAFPNEFADDDERKAYLVADNALAHLGGYDEQMQLTLLGELEEKGKLEGTGVTSDSIEDMRSAMSAVPESQAPDTWGGGYAEDAEAALARAEALATSQKNKEVVMMLGLEQHTQFLEDVKTLQGVYGFTAVKDTVVRAVHEQSELYRELALHQGAEPALGEGEDYIGPPADELAEVADEAAAIPAPTLEGEIPEIHEEQTNLLDDIPDPE